MGKIRIRGGWGVLGQGCERRGLDPTAWSALERVVVKLAFFSLQNDKTMVGIFTARIAWTFLNFQTHEK